MNKPMGSTRCGSCQDGTAATRFFRIVVDIEGIFAWCRECCGNPDLLLNDQIRHGVSREITEEEYAVHEVMDS